MGIFQVGIQLQRFTVATHGLFNLALFAQFHCPQVSSAIQVGINTHGFGEMLHGLFRLSQFRQIPA